VLRQQFASGGYDSARLPAHIERDEEASAPGLPLPAHLRGVYLVSGSPDGVALPAICVLSGGAGPAALAKTSKIKAPLVAVCAQPEYSAADVERLRGKIVLVNMPVRSSSRRPAARLGFGFGIPPRALEPVEEPSLTDALCSVLRKAEPLAVVFNFRYSNEVRTEVVNPRLAFYNCDLLSRLLLGGPRRAGFAFSPQWEGCPVFGACLEEGRLGPLLAEDCADGAIHADPSVLHWELQACPSSRARVQHCTVLGGCVKAAALSLCRPPLRARTVLDAIKPLKRRTCTESVRSQVQKCQPREELLPA
jgi:hypothetical protein